MSALRSRLRDYIHKMAKFEGAALGDYVVQARDITARVLQVAIPEGATAEQIAVCQEMAEYAAQQGVELVWQVVG